MHGDPAEPSRTRHELESAPIDDGVFAVAQELVRKTDVVLGHPSKVQFLRVLRAAGVRFKAPAWASSHQQGAIPFTYEFPPWLLTCSVWIVGARGADHERD